MSNLEKGQDDKASYNGNCNRDSIATTYSSAPLTTLSTLHKVDRVRRWQQSLTVFGAFLSLFCTFGQMNSFGTFETWYAIHQLNGTPSSTISWIGSLQLWVLFFSYVLSQGILFGIGAGLLFYPALASVSKCFSDHRATALGIAASGSSLGGVLYPIMLRSLFEHVGFGWTLRITALISLVLCGAATLTISSLAKSEARKRERSCREVSSWFTIFGLDDLRFLSLLLGSSLVALGLFIPIFYLSSFAHEMLSVSSSSSFLIVTALNGGGIFGRIAPSILSDRLGHFNLLAPTAFLSGLLVLTGWLIPASKAEELLSYLRSTNDLDSEPSEAHGLFVTVVVFAVLYGVFSGAFISLINPCVVKTTKDVTVVGRRIGFFYSVISFPSLIGTPIAGVLRSSGQSPYEGMILFSGITLVIGSFFLFATRFIVDRKAWVCV
ncbi:hypothetical protein D9758_007655 [Tetrapyrgos nigripes]|uniref:Major facilitator superfamily (MFS) profile domain-containing protein n=1 Tax=Tetrapyrgos nigripes TaxID=182062 RepID=A0A8H5LIF1_9AGAR|nr:hypothetical protein D9758_007655 [Tetrapyrgos nigripes]